MDIARMLVLGGTGLLFSRGKLDTMHKNTPSNQSFRKEGMSLWKCQLDSVLLTLQVELIATVVLSSLRTFLTKLTQARQA